MSETDPALTRMPALARKAGALARQNRDLRQKLLDAEFEAAHALMLLKEVENWWGPFVFPLRKKVRAHISEIEGRKRIPCKESEGEA